MEAALGLGTVTTHCSAQIRVPGERGRRRRCLAMCCFAFLYATRSSHAPTSTMSVWPGCARGLRCTLPGDVGVVHLRVWGVRGAGLVEIPCACGSHDERSLNFAGESFFGRSGGSEVQTEVQGISIFHPPSGSPSAPCSRSPPRGGTVVLEGWEQWSTHHTGSAFLSIIVTVYESCTKHISCGNTIRV